ncbi:hypothetical protein HDU81_011388 [Chytriomyces hyalinus]|nr:hypothetical protein HDU81_011388 [Chytriomyces hyalinus]
MDTAAVSHTRTYIETTPESDVLLNNWLTSLVVHLSFAELGSLLRDEERCLRLLRDEFYIKYARNINITSRQMTLMKPQVFRDSLAKYRNTIRSDAFVPAAVDVDIDRPEPTVVLHAKTYIETTPESKVLLDNWLTSLVVHLSFAELGSLLRDEERCLRPLRDEFYIKYARHIFIKKGHTMVFRNSLTKYRNTIRSDAFVPAVVDVNIDEPDPTEVNVKLEGPCKKQKFSDLKADIQDEPKTKDGCSEFDDVAKAIYKSGYLALRDDEKFRLESGRYVEDVMYSKCCTFSYEHLMHSFIFSPDDPTTTQLFSEEELLEIKETNVKETPDSYPSEKGLFWRYFSKFQGITDLSVLKTKLFNTCHPELFEDDPNEQWACQIYFLFLQNIWINASKNDSCFALDLSESWILSNPWQFVQNLFHDCKDVFVLGGEKGGLASQERKDLSRMVGGQSDLSRRAMGKKGDGYVRILGSEVRDVAAIEAGVKWEGAGATKAFIESEHILPKMLRDILWSMHKRLNNCPVALTEISIPGLAIYGNRCKRLSLDHVKGQVTRVESTDWLTLSMSGNVNDNLEVFMEVFLLRVWVLHNESIKPNHFSEKGDIFHELRKKLVKKENNTFNKFKLGVSHPTPKGKPRRK